MQRFSRCVTYPSPLQTSPKSKKMLAELCQTHSCCFELVPNKPYRNLICDSAQSLSGALSQFALITAYFEKYAHVRVRFFFRDAVVAQSFWGFLDTSWSGPTIPFGASVAEHLDPILSDTIVGVSVVATAFSMFTDGPEGEIYFGYVIDLLLHTEKENLETSQRPLIVPLVEELSPRLQRAELVVFIVCTKKPLAVTRSDSPEILLIVEKKNEWFLTAGHVERGDNFEDTACKEVIEESGYTLLRSSLVPFDLVYGSRSYDPKEGGLAPLYISYCAQIDESVPIAPAIDGNGLLWAKLDLILDEIASAQAGAESVNKGMFRGFPFRKPWELGAVLHRFANYLKKYYG